MSEKISKLAGVTFCNDPEDGGEDRQKLLKAINEIGKPILVDLRKVKFHNNDTGLDEDAIKVRVSSNGKMLGWIPRTDIEACWKYPQAVLYANLYKGTYYGTLFKSEPPTAKQYGAMKAKHLTRLPEYDRIIYSHELSLT